MTTLHLICLVFLLVYRPLCLMSCCKFNGPLQLKLKYLIHYRFRHAQYRRGDRHHCFVGSRPVQAPALCVTATDACAACPDAPAPLAIAPALCVTTPHPCAAGPDAPAPLAIAPALCVTAPHPCAAGPDAPAPLAIAPALCVTAPHPCAAGPASSGPLAITPALCVTAPDTCATGPASSTPLAIAPALCVTAQDPCAAGPDAPAPLAIAPALCVTAPDACAAGPASSGPLAITPALCVTARDACAAGPASSAPRARRLHHGLLLPSALPAPGPSQVQPSQLAVGEHGMPSMDKLDNLAEYIVELHHEASLTHPLHFQYHLFSHSTQTAPLVFSRLTFPLCTFPRQQPWVQFSYLPDLVPPLQPPWTIEAPLKG
ncbi:calphotin-like isoform X1 [Engraulis encrasicolus]|uniref:calphotin-like isoform X1 n=1 Tax=Engraulis encrasicolus TaxID=184585 RepID=UPI002FD630B5